MAAKTQPARGMRDFLPADVRRREYVIRIIKDVYERYGFEPLETPAVENIETLLGKYGEEGNQLIFKILKRGEHERTGEADLALRYDLTIPPARIVAESGEGLLGFVENLPALEHAAEFVGDNRGESRGEAYNRAALGRLVEFVGDHEAGARGVDELRRIVEYAASYGVADKIKIDPSLARGLSYYTGAIMEISAGNDIGSIGGGGRYDKLVGMFLGKGIPAGGFEW